MMSEKLDSSRGAHDRWQLSSRRLGAGRAWQRGREMPAMTKHKKLPGRSCALKHMLHFLKLHTELFKSAYVMHSMLTADLVHRYMILLSYLLLRSKHGGSDMGSVLCKCLRFALTVSRSEGHAGCERQLVTQPLEEYFIYFFKVGGK